MNGIKINNQHSYDDLDLILKSRELPLPKMKSNVIDIPNSNGSIDMSTVLTNGKPKFENRPLKFTFWWLSDGIDTTFKKITTLWKLFHGQMVNIILDDEPMVYFVGRATLDWADYKYYMQVVINVDAQPYRLFLQETEIIENVVNSANLTITNDEMDVIPNINCSVAMSCTFNNKVYILSAGDNFIPDIKFIEGTNEIAFTGTGTVKLKYREGCF